MKFSTRKFMAQRIRELRKRERCTQSDLADALKISRASLAKMEGAEQGISERTLNAIVNEYGISLYEFLFGASSKSISEALRDFEQKLSAQRKYSEAESIAKVVDVIEKSGIKLLSGYVVVEKDPSASCRHEWQLLNNGTEFKCLKCSLLMDADLNEIQEAF